MLDPKLNNLIIEHNLIKYTVFEVLKYMWSLEEHDGKKKYIYVYIYIRYA